MYSLNSVKILFVLAMLWCPACSWWRGETEATPTPAPFVAEELKSEIPFSTKEPDIYQTEIVATGENGFEEKTFAAKNGANRLLIVDFQEKTETALLQIGENQSFLIAKNQKIFTDNQSPVVAAKGESLNSFLTTELLNRKADAVYEKLGAENNVVKYRVRLEDAKNFEIIISVDEKIGLPIRQEFYGIVDERKILTLTMELKNFSLQTDAGVFEVPKDYRKVSPREFREILQRERIK